jgi:hypothetical protein
VESTGYIPEPILLPMHLTPDDGEESLAVDEDTNAILLDDLVELSRLLYILEVVLHASAPFISHTYTNKLGCWS